MLPKQVFLSLGSNLGDRRENLQQAIDALEREGVRVIAQSPIYETEPQDVTGQPWFVNLALQCETTCFPLQLLTILQRIEHDMGRVRGGRPPRGPRIIDLDILLFGRVVMNTPRLTIPHPRLLERRFALQPLLDIAPSLIHPVTGERLERYLPEVAAQKVRLARD